MKLYIIVLLLAIFSITNALTVKEKFMEKSQSEREAHRLKSKTLLKSDGGDSGGDGSCSDLGQAGCEYMGSGEGVTSCSDQTESSLCLSYNDGLGNNCCEWSGDGGDYCRFEHWTFVGSPSAHVQVPVFATFGLESHVGVNPTYDPSIQY